MASERFWLTASVCATLLCGAYASSQDSVRNRTVEAVRAESPPVIDGILDDPCWKQLPSVSGFTDAMLGTPVAEDTVVWIGYDDTSIYVAFRCWDTRPEEIVARERKRGVRFRGEDRVRLYVDPFNRKTWEDQSMLDVNPLGTQFARFAGGRAGKLEWEGIWQSSAQIDEQGWTVEMAVPWSNFARPHVTGRATTIGINFERYQARTQIRSYWSNVGPQSRFEYSGEWVGVVLPPENESRRLSMIGYVYGGASNGSTARRSGFDARYRFSPLQNLVFSYNPDFSDIESAVTSVDFSYSEVLPDESRPFFLEGRDYFRTADYRATAFVPVRIPAFDAGAKFYGKSDTLDFGLLGTHKLGDRTDWVANLLHRPNLYQSWGLQLVGSDTDQLRNTVAMATGRVRLGDWYLNGLYSVSSDTTGPGESARVGIGWAPNRWFVAANFMTVSPGYRQRNGFVPFLDQRGFSVFSRYDTDWRTGAVRSLEWNLDAYRYERYDGSLFRQGISTSAEIRTDHYGVDLGFSAGRFLEHDDVVFSFGVNAPPLDQYRNVGFRFRFGQLAGLSYRAFSLRARWRFWDQLNIGFSSELILIGETRRQDILSVAYDFAPDRGIGGRLVRRGDSYNWYLSYRRSGYGGLEMFIILGDPNSERFSERLLVKLVKAF